MGPRKVFLDSSVLVAALLSPRGGSFYLLTHTDLGYELKINKYVLDEVVRVLEAKFAKKKNMKQDLFLLLGLGRVDVVPNPESPPVREAAAVVEESDAPILAGAAESSSYLVTLDQDFLGETVRSWAAERGLAIMAPKDFITGFRKRSL